MRKNATLVVLFLGMSGCLLAQTSGTIKGIVLDEQRKPLTRAEVRVAETKPFYGSRVLDFHETDADGQFAIERLTWGTYAVMARKEESGYADMGLAFYSNLKVPKVTLSPTAPVAEVTVQLGPKAGLLDIVSLTDTVTGENILDSGRITVRRVKNPNFLIATSTKMLRPLFVPALTEVSVEITAPGYEPWPAPDHADQRGRIFLKPEEVFELDVQLQPTHTRK
jgi:hypothetical protein